MVNTLFCYAVYFGLLSLRLSAQVALAVAAIASAFFNYFTTGSLVFAKNDMGRLPQFLVTCSAAYLLNALLLEGLTGIGVAPALAQAFVLPAVILTNYAIMNCWVFRQSGNEP